MPRTAEVTSADDTSRQRECRRNPRAYRRAERRRIILCHSMLTDTAYFIGKSAYSIPAYSPVRRRARTACGGRVEHGREITDGPQPRLLHPLVPPDWWQRCAGRAVPRRGSGDAGPARADVGRGSSSVLTAAR
jgi:hypothetical protein